MNSFRACARTFVTIVAASLALGGCATTTHRAHAAAEEPTDTVPVESHDSVVEALRNNQHLAALSGKVVVVAVYATWCPAARKMLHALASLSNAEGARGLVIMGVSEDENLAAAESFARGVGLAEPVTLDANGDLARRLKLTTIPALIVIGRDGAVRRVHAGYRGEETDRMLDREVQALLTAPRPEFSRDALARDE